MALFSETPFSVALLERRSSWAAARLHDYRLEIRGTSQQNSRGFSTELGKINFGETALLDSYREGTRAIADKVLSTV